MRADGAFSCVLALSQTLVAVGTSFGRVLVFDHGDPDGECYPDQSDQCDVFIAQYGVVNACEYGWCPTCEYPHTCDTTCEELGYAPWCEKEPEVCPDECAHFLDDGCGVYLECPGLCSATGDNPMHNELFDKEGASAPDVEMVSGTNPGTKFDDAVEVVSM